MEKGNATSLFHYTNNFDNLVGILRNGFYPNYCMEVMPDGKIWGIPLVSFCDIPLTRAGEHRGRYGKFAVGLSENWGSRIQLNPVMYVKSEPMEACFSELSGVWEAPNSSGHTSTASRDTNGIPAFDYLRGFIKMHSYEDKGTRKCNYDDHEWRYIAPVDEQNDWLRSEEAFRQWRGDRSTPKPRSTFQPLKFKAQDIQYILLEKESESLKLIDAVGRFKSIGGDRILEETDRQLLLTKVLSVERLSTDF